MHHTTLTTTLLMRDARIIVRSATQKISHLTFAHPKEARTGTFYKVFLMDCGFITFFPSHLLDRPHWQVFKVYFFGVACAYQLTVKL